MWESPTQLTASCSACCAAARPAMHSSSMQPNTRAAGDAAPNRGFIRILFSNTKFTVSSSPSRRSASAGRRARGKWPFWHQFRSYAVLISEMRFLYVIKRFKVRLRMSNRVSPPRALYPLHFCRLEGPGIAWAAVEGTEHAINTFCTTYQGHMRGPLCTSFASAVMLEQAAPPNSTVHAARCAHPAPRATSAARLAPPAI